MLNELLVAERGLAAADVSMTPRHRDIMDARKGLPTLLVLLNADGVIDTVRPVPADVRPWTLGDGNHNRFPFVQPKLPFWKVPVDHSVREIIGGRDAAARRNAILELTNNVEFNGEAAMLIGAKFEKRLQERATELSADDSNYLAACVAKAMRRFLCAVGPSSNYSEFAKQLSVAIVEAMRDSADDLLTDIAAGLLVGKPTGKKIVAQAGLLIDATPDNGKEDRLPLWHPDVAAAVSEAMQIGVASIEPAVGDETVQCALTGEIAPLLSGSFPNPNLPTVGPTILFSRNTDTPSLGRYRQFEEAMPVGCTAAEKLAAAAGALTQPHREGKTWRSIPGERPKQTDLMLAYVAAAPDAPVADMVTSERELEQLTSELVDAVKAKVQEDGLVQTPVRFTVLRRVDPGNRKAIVNDVFTVQRLVDAANDWRAARRLIPPHLRLPVPVKGKTPVSQTPPSFAPLSLISFTRPIFIRGGKERTDAIGITAAEALALFLDEGRAAERRAARVLRIALRRRTALVAGCAHARRRGFDDLKAFDRLEVLRTVTVLCVLLHKLGRHKETKMKDSPAYKLGQLLAAADAVHAGYCADVRGGKLPPSLLGNQVFVAAQKSPVRALDMLCRRWKPYGAWATPSDDAWKRAEQLVQSNKKEEQRRGWDIRMALRHARDWKPLAEELAEVLPSIAADDSDRAELLLGYLAGLPKPEREASSHEQVNNELE